MVTRAPAERRRRRQQGCSLGLQLLLPPLVVALLLLLLLTTTTTPARGAAEVDVSDEAAVLSPAAYSAALAEAVAAVLPSSAAAATSSLSISSPPSSAAGASSSAVDPIAAELAWEAVERQRFLHKQKEEEEEEEEEEEREREGEAKEREESEAPSSPSRPPDGPWTSPFEKPLADLDAEEASERAAEAERELVDRMIEEATEAQKRAAAAAAGAAAAAAGTAAAPSGPLPTAAAAPTTDASASSAAAPSAALSSTATKGAPAGEPPPPSAKDANGGGKKRSSGPPEAEADGDEEPPPYNPSFPSPVGVGVPRSGGPLLLSDSELALSPFAVSGARPGATENYGNTRPLLSLSAALPALYDPAFGGRGLPAPRPGVPRPPAPVRPPLLNSFAAKAEYAAYLRAGFRDDMQAAENERPKPRRESSADGTPPSGFPPSPLAAVASSTEPNEFGARTDDIPVVASTRLDVLPSALANRARDGLEASRTLIANGSAPVGLSFAANAAVDQPSRRFRPPDQSLCVGNGVVITGNNLVLRTWDAETGAPLQGPIAQPDFFGLDGNFSDPSCIFDAQDSKRFFVSVFRFNEVQPGKYSQFVVAVSRTSDPADGFLGPYVIRNDGLDVKGEKPLPGLERCGGGFSKKANQTAEAGCLGDYPSVGLDAHSLWSGFNLFRTAPLDGYAGSLVVAVSKRDLVSGKHRSPALAYYSNFDQTLAYTVQPTQTQPGTPHDAARNGTVYLVSTAPVVQSEPNVPALAAWAATQTSLLSEEDFPRRGGEGSSPPPLAAAEPAPAAEEISRSDFSFAAAAAASSSPSSSPTSPSTAAAAAAVDPFPGIPRISNAAVIPTPAYRDPGAFKKAKLAVQQPSPGWGLDGGDARTLQHVLSGGLCWTSAQTVMRVGGPQAPLTIGAVYFALLPEWEARRRRRGAAAAPLAASSSANPLGAPPAEQQRQGLFAEREEEELDDGTGEGEAEEVYAPKLVAAGYVAAPGGRSIARPAVVATRTGTAYIAAYMSGADFAMSPVIAEVDLFSGPARVMVPALSPVPLEPSNADRLFRAGDPKGGGTLRVGDYAAAVLGDDLRSAWLASEWSGGVPSPACVEQQGATKCPSWSTFVSRVDLPREARGDGDSPTAAERVRAARKGAAGGVEVGKRSGAGGGLGRAFSPSSSSSSSFPLPKVGGALGGPVAGGDKALAALAAEAKKASSSSGQKARK